MESSKDHHDPGGGFRNPWDSYQKRSTLSLFGSIRKDPEKADVAALMLLAGRPDFNLVGSSQRKKARSIAATWIGHCTFVVQMEGGNFLTDPIWSMRCGSFPGPKRVVPPPCELDELPTLDAILITSNRPDHLDKSTVQNLGNRAEWLVPLGVGEFLREHGVTRYTEMDWWESRKLERGATVVCTPSQHFSGRNAKDRDEALWCSWTVVGPSSRFFFSGSTGYRSKNKKGSRQDRDLLDRQDYGRENGVAFGESLPKCPAFRQIGRQYGPFDVAFLPIGGYGPKSVMSAVNAEPLDSVGIHRDVGAKCSVAMNWGTFQLSDEELLDPLRELERALIDKRVPESSFLIMKHGKTQII
uniref:Metallo-beta-lactamase domain-containing protein n=1 Tax=Rhodosorus marinus TaxID=101924 RepID=A0A7S0BJA4_9RHOD|mmetsp:Transcript_17827/g.25739  ORF Transcript_17827/g.25739 Transcript_17827/m.25739 type:complete len:356 (+) Transcript_17827:645-1712(+)